MRAINLAVLTASCIYSFVYTQSALSQDVPRLPVDQHYNEVGFFDVHYCNWSDRPKFFLVLFSTKRYKEIKQIDTYNPDGGVLKQMDLSRYKLIEKKGKPTKRVFVSEVPADINAIGGWFSAKVTLHDGTIHGASDFVYITAMPLAKNVVPKHRSENIPVPRRLSWDPVPGAKYYKVFLSDLWDDGRIIFDSGLLNSSHVDLPKGLIKKNGWYQWNVHARDVNEHVLFGDFNHGSNLVGLQFTTSAQ